jgi:hypothetical protein
MEPSEVKAFSIFWQRWRKLLAMVTTHQSILCLLRNKEKNKASCCLDKVQIQLARPKIGIVVIIHEPII